jgi:type IV pilus assembly protein PilE
MEKRTAGFTLIELLVTVVVVAVLASLAIPAYRDFVDRGRRVVALSILTELQAEQQTFRLKQRRFATDFESLVSIKADTLYVGKDRRLTSSKAGTPLYAITLDTEDDEWTGFTAEAVGVQSRDDDCATIAISALGLQSAENAAGAGTTAECWR